MTQKGLSRQDLIHWLESRGYRKNPRSNSSWQKTPKRRFKLNKLAVRYEVRCGDSWVRIRSGYYKNLYINPENGKLGGLR